ncbi:alkaline phosphatase family protein, partial [candidate division CSSED10-310 bacterium]
MKVLIVGIDALTPGLVEYLISKSCMPNLENTIRNGSKVIIQTRIPLKSPLIWTTIATGVLPEFHGITDFILEGTVVNSTFRKVPAFWNIMATFNVKGATLNWYASWPAEKNAGIIISDYMFFEKYTQRACPEGVIDTSKHLFYKYLTDTSIIKRFTTYPIDPDFKKNLKKGTHEYLLNDLIFNKLLYH